MASALLQATKTMKKQEVSIETTTNRSRPSAKSNMHVDFPWNIDDIFQADTDRFGQLKDVIKFIVDRLDQTTKSVTSIDTKVNMKLMQVDKNKTSCDELKKDNVQQNRVMKELEEKSITVENDLSELKSDLEAARMNLILSNGRQKKLKESIEEHDKQIKELMNQTPGPVMQSGGNVDLNSLNTMFVNRTAFDQLMDRVRNLEVNDTKQDQDIEDLKKGINNFDQFLQQHDQQLAEMNEIINYLQSNAGGSSAPIAAPRSNADIAKMQAQIVQINSDLADKCSKGDFEMFRETLKLKADDAFCRKEFDKLERMVEALRQQCTVVASQSDQTKKETDQLSQLVDFLSKAIQGLKAQPQQAAPAASGIDENLIRQMLERLSNLENDLMGFKDEFARWFEKMQNELNNKADIETVKALEQSLMDRLNQIVQQLSKQFADKTDTRKALKLLEKNLKNMYDLFMSKQGHENEDDAMFTKKPLGGQSCASCAKDVVDLYGKQVQYLPWGKLPFRDPSERIARVGQGFSKMLSMINPEQLSRYDGQNFQHGSQEGLQGVYEQQQQMLNQDGIQNNRMKGQGGMPPNGKSSTTLKQQYNGVMINDPNRPASAQVKQTRPFTRGASKSRKGNYQ